MYNRRLKKAITKNLTPKKAWDEYVTMSPEMFISNFQADPNYSSEDIKGMCRIFTLEIPSDEIYTDKQLKLIEGLLLEYLETYIEKKGGMDKLDLIPPEVLYEMDAIETEYMLNLIADFCGVPREEIGKKHRPIKPL